MDLNKILSMKYPERPPAPPLPAPRNISPTIRFFRWYFLIAGIVYGARRHSYLQNRADKNKELRDTRKKARLEEEAKQKIIREKEELVELGKILQQNII